MDFDTDWEKETYAQAAEAMKTLLHLANSMGSDKAIIAGMLDALVTEHRTLQQACIRHFVGMLKTWSQGNHDALADARNEATWKFAQAVAKLDPVFPLI